MGGFVESKTKALRNEMKVFDAIKKDSIRVDNDLMIRGCTLVPPGRFGTMICFVLKKEKPAVTRAFVFGKRKSVVNETSICLVPPSRFHATRDKRKHPQADHF